MYFIEIYFYAKPIVMSIYLIQTQPFSLVSLIYNTISNCNVSHHISHIDIFRITSNLNWGYIMDKQLYPNVL